MKRRRTRTSSDAGSPSQEKKVAKSPPAIASAKSTSSSIKDGASKSSDGQQVAYTEDLELEKRSAADDVASFEKGTEVIRQLVAEIQRQKKEDETATVIIIIADLNNPTLSHATRLHVLRIM